MYHDKTNLVLHTCSSLPACYSVSFTCLLYSAFSLYWLGLGCWHPFSSARRFVCVHNCGYAAFLTCNLVPGMGIAHAHIRHPHFAYERACCCVIQRYAHGLSSRIRIPVYAGCYTQPPHHRTPRSTFAYTRKTLWTCNAQQLTLRSRCTPPSRFNALRFQAATPTSKAAIYP